MSSQSDLERAVAALAAAISRQMTAADELSRARIALAKADTDTQEARAELNTLIDMLVDELLVNTPNLG